MKKKIIFCIIISCFVFQAQGQEKKNLSLKETIHLGLQHSKQLHFDSSNIQTAIAQLKSIQDNSLPSANISYGYSKAFMLTDKFQLPIPGQEHPIALPKDNNIHLGTLSITELIYGGNKVRMAKASADILINIQKYNYQDQKDKVILQLIKAYFGLYKTDKTLKVIQQTLSDIHNNIDKVKAFKSQGMATKNDVLRWKLQLANARLDSIDISNGRKVINYTLDLLLGLSENTIIQPSDSVFNSTRNITFEQASQNAIASRSNLKAMDEQLSLSKLEIKSAKNNMLPVLAAAGNLYYINPNSQFIPNEYTYIAPFSIGLNLSWDISSLYTTKHKVNVAKTKRQAAKYQKAQLTDEVKIQVKKAYLNYKKAKDKLNVLNVAVDQALENKNIFAAKYKNHIASTTERIDAETQLFKSKIQLELAKVEVQLSYYKMLQTTGKLNIQSIK